MRRAQLRRIASRLLTMAGLERAGAGPWQDLGTALARAHTAGVAPRTVIDVGVGYGTPELYGAFPAARLILVEPLEEMRGALIGQLSHRRAEVVSCAAGAADGEKTMYVHLVPTLSSTRGRRVGDELEPEERRVQVRRLDGICSELAAEPGYVLKADVEGDELDVVAGAEGILSGVELLVLETSLIELTEGAPHLSEVVARVLERGFVVYDLAGGHRRPLDGALAQLDVLFVPEDSGLRSHRGYASAGQARALYRSWGFSGAGESA